MRKCSRTFDHRASTRIDGELIDVEVAEHDCSSIQELGDKLQIERREDRSFVGSFACWKIVCLFELLIEFKCLMMFSGNFGI